MGSYFVKLVNSNYQLLLEKVDSKTEILICDVNKTVESETSQERMTKRRKNFF